MAGHRSSGDGGDDVERQLTNDLARACKLALRAAGYETDWLQEIDQDSGPTTMLSTWHGPGNVSSDTFTNNTLGARMAEAIARQISGIPSMRLKGRKSGRAGVMLENETRVGEEGSRLGIMATTAPFRVKSVRLSIERGGTNDAGEEGVAVLPVFFVSSVQGFQFTDGSVIVARGNDPGEYLSHIS